MLADSFTQPLALYIQRSDTLVCYHHTWLTRTDHSQRLCISNDYFTLIGQEWRIEVLDPNGGLIWIVRPNSPKLVDDLCACEEVLWNEDTLQQILNKHWWVYEPLQIRTKNLAQLDSGVDTYNMDNIPLCIIEWIITFEENIQAFLLTLFSSISEYDCSMAWYNWLQWYSHEALKLFQSKSASNIWDIVKSSQKVRSDMLQSVIIHWQINIDNMVQAIIALPNKKILHSKTYTNWKERWKNFIQIIESHPDINSLLDNVDWLLYKLWNIHPDIFYLISSDKDLWIFLENIDSECNYKNENELLDTYVSLLSVKKQEYIPWMSLVSRKPFTATNQETITIMLSQWQDNTTDLWIYIATKLLVLCNQGNKEHIIKNILNKRYPDHESNIEGITKYFKFNTDKISPGLLKILLHDESFFIFTDTILHDPFKISILIGYLQISDSYTLEDVSIKDMQKVVTWIWTTDTNFIESLQVLKSSIDNELIGQIYFNMSKSAYGVEYFSQIPDITERITLLFSNSSPKATHTFELSTFMPGPLNKNRHHVIHNILFMYDISILKSFLELQVFENYWHVSMLGWSEACMFKRAFSEDFLLGVAQAIEIWDDKKKQDIREALHNQNQSQLMRLFPQDL